MRCRLVGRVVPQPSCETSQGFRFLVLGVVLAGWALAALSGDPGAERAAPPLSVSPVAAG